MSKKQYIATFSDIHPSDEAMERIMCMKDKKQGIVIKKAAVVLAVAISVLFALGAVAYATTDGEIVNSVVDVIDLIAGKAYVFVNGEKTEADLDISTQVNEDGETVYYVEMKIPSLGSDSKVEVGYECVDGANVSEMDLFIQDELESAMQATQEE